MRVNPADAGDTQDYLAVRRGYARISIGTSAHHLSCQKIMSAIQHLPGELQALRLPLLADARILQSHRGYAIAGFAIS